MDMQTAFTQTCTCALHLVKVQYQKYMSSLLFTQPMSMHYAYRSKIIRTRSHISTHACANDKKNTATKSWLLSRYDPIFLTSLLFENPYCCCSQAPFFTSLPTTKDQWIITLYEFIDDHEQLLPLTIISPSVRSSIKHHHQPIAITNGQLVQRDTTMAFLPAIPGPIASQ